MDWREHKKRLLKDPEFRAEYEALEPEYRLAAALIRLRLAKGLTQEELAKLLNTKQESIARLESGTSLPSLSTVKKVADVLDAELEINLRPRDEKSRQNILPARQTDEDNILVNEISNEYLDRLFEARRWLKRARNDYRGYVKIVGRQYLSSKKELPEDAALAVYLIQQAIEKTVKAVALASGQFESRELRKEYSHNSLKLLSDMLLKLIDIPMIGSALSVMKAGLGKTGEKYLDVNDIRNRIIDVKQNTDFNRPPDVPDWMREFALLPPQAVKPVVTMLSDLRSKLQSALYKLLKPNVSFDFEKAKNYLAEPTDSNLQGVFGPAFRTERVPQDTLSVAVNMFPIFKGSDFHTLLADAIQKEGGSLRGRVKVGKRQAFEESVFAGWALCMLMLLAAFTFPHEGWTRYPDRYKGEADLDCESYTDRLGIVSCLREIGNLTRDTIGDTDKLLETIAGFFATLTANTKLASK